jgi:hypothetical protein
MKKDNSTRLRVGLVALTASLISSLVSAQVAQLPFNERQATVRIVMSTSRNYNGTYNLTEVARVCGEVPAERNFAGVSAFGVQLYPESGAGEVMDVTFDSKELVGGVTSSSRFFLSVIVQSPAIGRPPAYVLDTAQARMRGSATLSTEARGTITLKVVGVNDRDETIDLTLTCMPAR